MDEKTTILTWLLGTLDSMQVEAEAIGERYHDHLAGTCDARERRDLIRRATDAAKTLEKFAAKLKAEKSPAKAA